MTQPYPEGLSETAGDGRATTRGSHAGPARSIPDSGIAALQRPLHPADMKLSGEVTIHASADRVWAIVGPQFAQIGDWATSIAASHPADDARPQPGRPAVVGRVCETRVSTFAQVTESVIAFDSTNRIEHKRASTACSRPAASSV